MYKEDEMENEKKVVQSGAKSTAKKVASAVGTAGKVATAGALVVGHCIFSVIGAILCAVTSQD